VPFGDNADDDEKKKFNAKIAATSFFSFFCNIMNDNGKEKMEKS
jgi:hypothetical protein